MERLNILGVGISAVNMDQAVDAIVGWIGQRQTRYVCVTPVHSVMACQRDDGLRRIFNASGMTTPDGMPLVWICRLMGMKHVGRVYGPDLMLAVCRVSQAKGHRHFLYGSTPKTLEHLEHRLRRMFPNLIIAGVYAPPFRPMSPDEDRHVTRLINGANPDVLWVGLGSPKQERWMAAHADRLTVPVMIGVGAAFDFHAGLKGQAPQWMRKIGLEWFFRLLTEPTRLWRRYALANPAFLVLVTAQLLRLRRFPME